MGIRLYRVYRLLLNKSLPYRYLNVPLKPGLTIIVNGVPFFQLKCIQVLPILKVFSLRNCENRIMEWCKENGFEIMFEGDFLKKGDHLKVWKTRHFKLASQISGSMILVLSWNSRELAATRPEEPRALYDISHASLISSPTDLSIACQNVITFSGMGEFNSPRKKSGILKTFSVRPVDVKTSVAFKRALKQSGKHVLASVPTLDASRRQRKTNIGLRSQLTMTRDLEKRLPLNQEYSLLETLGKGGFATVYRAVQNNNGNEVAVKIFLAKSTLLNNGFGNEDADEAEEYEFQRNCFEWEIKAMKLLKEKLGQHENIVKLFQVCNSKAPKGTAIVMEMLDGGELFDKIVEREYFTETDGAAIFRTLVFTMNELHKIGIYHRDLKPENIIFKGEILKIADFGTAFIKELEDADPFKGMRVGSPGYFAPECIRHVYTSACDVFSLGVLLYCLLSGYQPFEGTGGELLVKLISGQFEFHEEKWANISDDAKDLISKMLRPSMSERISLEDALRHPWLLPSRRPSQMNLGLTLIRLQNFNEERRMQKQTVQSMYEARLRINKSIATRNTAGSRTPLSRFAAASQSARSLMSTASGQSRTRQTRDADRGLREII